MEVPKARRFQDLLASSLVDVEVPTGRRLEKLLFERAAARRRRRDAVNRILLGCVLAASVGIVASDVVTSRRGMTTTLSQEPATLPSGVLTPPADARSKSDNTRTSARQAESIGSGPVGAATSQGLVELRNASEPVIGAIPAGQGAADPVFASPVEKPMKSAPVKAFLEARAKPTPGKAVLPRPEKHAGSAPQAAWAPVSRSDGARKAADSPDPAEIIDWLLKEYSPRGE